MQLFGLFHPVNAKRAEAKPLPVDRALRETLAKNLRTARINAGLSQEELADLADLSRKHVGRIERGVANVSIDVLAVLASHVGKTAVDLLTPDLTA